MIHLAHPVLPILAALAILVATGRWRTDLVAPLALLVCVLTGVVAPTRALDGFAQPAVATVAMLSVFGLAIRNSGVVDALLAILRPLLRWGTSRVAVFGLVGGLLSAVVGSLTVLSWMLSTAVQGIRRDREQAAPLLMPIGLLAMLGGLTTLVGTLPNLLLDTLFPGRFGLFGFAHAGLPVAAAGLVTVLGFWRFLPQARSLVQPSGAVQTENYTSELLVPPGSPLVGLTVHAVEERSEGTVALKGIVREAFRRIEPRADWQVEAGDILVLECEPLVLQRLMERSGLQIVGGTLAGGDPDRVGVVEAVVTPASELVGRSAGEDVFAARRISLLAVGRSGRPPAGRLRRTRLQAGDVLMLQGELAAMPATLAGLGCLTLTERRLRLGRRRSVLVPLATLVACLAAVGTGALSLPLALLAGVVGLVGARALTLEEVYAAIPWPILVVAATLLPIAAAVRDGGTAEAVAAAVGPVLAGVPDGAVPVALLAVALAAALLLGGTVTLLLLAPFAAALAARLGVPVEGALAALALGASCEFVARPGRYSAIPLPGQLRWRHSWRLLLPLYGVVLVVGGAALVLGWPAVTGVAP